MNTHLCFSNFNLHTRLKQSYIKLADEFGKFRGYANIENINTIFDISITKSYEKDTHPFTGEKLDTE